MEGRKKHLQTFILSRPREMCHEQAFFIRETSKFKSSRTRIKGIVQSLFTHHHVVLNLYDKMSSVEHCGSLFHAITMN